MPGLDLLVSRYLSQEIKNQLPADVLRKTEKELFFSHGMSIKLSIEHFDEFHNVLKKVSSLDLKTFEKDCIKKIIQVRKSKYDFKVKILNKKLLDKIFNFYGDPESRKILFCIMGKTHTVSEILKDSGILKSSAYRKIENLLLDGLIFESGKVIVGSKRVSQYTCIFDEFRATMMKNRLTIECVVNSTNFNKSSIAQTGLFED